MACVVVVVATYPCILLFILNSFKFYFKKVEQFCGQELLSVLNKSAKSPPKRQVFSGDERLLDDVSFDFEGRDRTGTESERWRRGSNYWRSPTHFAGGIPNEIQNCATSHWTMWLVQASQISSPSSASTSCRSLSAPSTAKVSGQGSLRDRSVNGSEQ